MTMWFLLLVIHAMSAAPQLKYVESAIHFDPKADNSTATINNQEKAAALNSIYHNHAELAHAAHADQADDEDCCCSLPVHTVDHSSPGLRIVNRPPPTNDGHYHHQHHQHHQPEQHHQHHHHQQPQHHQHHQQQKTCQPLACCKRKSQQVPRYEPKSPTSLNPGLINSV